jgi:hypothetical protein
LLFNPKGFLVAILEDDEHAERARAALREAGFADRDLRVCTSQQILDDHERFLAQRSIARRVVSAVAPDPDSIQRYVDRAREGRSALWVHVPDDADAARCPLPGRPPGPSHPPLRPGPAGGHPHPLSHDYLNSSLAS